MSFLYNKANEFQLVKNDNINVYVKTNVEISVRSLFNSIN